MKLSFHYPICKAKLHHRSTQKAVVLQQNVGILRLYSCPISCTNYNYKLLGNYVNDLIHLFCQKYLYQQ